jgi:acyl-coenzyme A synthetase/AMP-(fatty) acid ligase
MEIYGCTEAGSMATRRTVDTSSWQLHPGMRIQSDGEAIIVTATHLPEAINLNDVVEIEAPQHFRLLGRDADMLKVGGKRASLADLTQRLLDIDGVHDGVLFVPDGSERPAALVVADADESQILAALAPQIDAVFLPRPLRRVASLPRDALGKLPRAALMEALRNG